MIETVLFCKEKTRIATIIAVPTMTFTCNNQKIISPSGQKSLRGRDRKTRRNHVTVTPAPCLTKTVWRFQTESRPGGLESTMQAVRDVMFRNTFLSPRTPPPSSLFFFCLSFFPTLPIQSKCLSIPFRVYWGTSRLVSLKRFLHFVTVLHPLKSVSWLFGGLVNIVSISSPFCRLL